MNLERQTFPAPSGSITILQILSRSSDSSPDVWCVGAGAGIGTIGGGSGGSLNHWVKGGVDVCVPDSKLLSLNRKSDKFGDK